VAKEDQIEQYRFDNRTAEEQREIARQGGIASGEARREKATMLQTLEQCLNAKNKSGQTYKELATLGLIKGAVNGSANNYKIIQELMEKQEKKNDAKKIKVYLPAKDIPRSFVDIYRDIENRKYYEYWLEGGRGSDKSSIWSEIVAELLENNPNMCALLIRKVGNTLKDSVFSQMQWGIDKLAETYPEVSTHWKPTKSPLEITNTETGQIIYFRGADDPVKIKSIRPPKDKYIGVVVYEECDQMNGMEEIGTIDRSVVRGGEDFIVFRVYNTPRSSRHFINIEKKKPKKDRIVHRSTYLDVPKEWLGQKFFDEADYMKETNENQWRNIYLGEEIGDGGNVFENVEIREITDEEIDTFDYIYQGIDWGYFPDIFAWIKCCYNSSQKVLYIFDEFTVNKMSNADVWEHLKNDKKVTEDDLIIADSAEPKSIGDFRMYGACIKGAEKGAGSVEYSMKWLSSLAKIVIDQRRCPVSAQEFSTYEYQQDKDGNYISGYVDADNHCIDATRYALNMIWKKKGQ
jgi:PBSX family phage terminase large subunit